MGLYSQNRIMSIHEDAECLEMFHNIQWNDNTMSILETCLYADKLIFTNDQTLNTITESVFLPLNEATPKRAEEVQHATQSSMDKGNITPEQKEQIDKNATNAVKTNTGQTQQDAKNNAPNNSNNNEQNKNEKPVKDAHIVNVDRDKLFNKVEDLIQKFIQAIQKAADTIQSKFRALVMKTETKTVQKYQKYINDWDKYSSGFKGVEVVNIELAKQIGSEQQDTEKSIAAIGANPSTIGQDAKKAINQIMNAQNVEDVNKYYTEFKENVAKDNLNTLDYKSKIKDIKNNKEDKESGKGGLFIPSTTELKQYEKTLLTGSAVYLDQLDSLKRDTMKVLKEEELQAKANFKAEKKDGEELQTAKLQKVYDIHRTVAKQTGNIYSASANDVIAQYKIARKCYVACGKYARSIAQGGTPDNTEENNENQGTQDASASYKFNTNGSVAVSETDMYIANLEAYMYGESSDEFLSAVFEGCLV